MQLRYRLRTFRAGLRVRFALLPPVVAVPRLQYTTVLVGYVIGLFGLSLAIAGETVRPRGDVVTIGIAAVAIVAMSSYSVNALTGLSRTWTATGFIHLSMSLAFGPPGALAASVSETAGCAMRYRSGWFRATFNFSTCFLADVAAYWLDSAVITAYHPGILGAGCAGVAAGGVQWLANHGLTAIVVRLTQPEARIRHSLRRSLFSLPYNFGYGWSAAFAVVAVQGGYGVVGFSALLMPVVLLQAFLVVLERHVNAHAEEERRYARDREALLQRAIDASEAERRRIARDLHDGVVQNLAAFALMLDGAGQRVAGRADDPEVLLDEADEVMGDVARATRSAMDDLRSLILEIAPPSDESGGLESSLDGLLPPLRAGGVTVHVAVSGGGLIPPNVAQLTIRVAQEALRNVAQHARARTVSLTVTASQGEGLLMRVTDDGRGFSDDDVRRRRASGHVGTRLLGGLCEEAGAVLSITSQPGRGTLVELRAPLHVPETATVVDAHASSFSRSS